MKKLYLAILLCLCIPLTACGGSAARTSFDALSAKMQDASALSFEARIRAEYDDSTAEFTLAYAEKDGESTVTVISPDIIRGVSAHMKSGETALEYDGVMLDTGALDSFGLSPMSALPLLAETLRTGYLDSAWDEGEERCALLVPSDGVSVEVHMDKYTLTPLSAEISSDGRVRVFAELTGWTLTDSAAGTEIPSEE